MTERQLQLYEQSLREDTFYQDLLRTCNEMHADYLRIKASLPENDQDILDRYIFFTCELECRSSMNLLDILEMQK